MGNGEVWLVNLAIVALYEKYVEGFRCCEKGGLETIVLESKTAIDHHILIFVALNFLQNGISDEGVEK